MIQPFTELGNLEEGGKHVGEKGILFRTDLQQPPLPALSAAFLSQSIPSL